MDKESSVNIRVTDEEKQSWIEIQNKQGFGSVSEFIRQNINEQVKSGKSPSERLASIEGGIRRIEKLLTGEE